MSFASGTRIGSYEVVSAIGKGGMGEVYRVRDTRLDRDVAIKTLPEEFAADPDRLARFEREAKLLASLNHPNIAAIYGLERFEGRHFLVLELVEGETLADHIARGPIPVDESRRLAVQIAEALQAAHEKGVVHRDLKPANIKLTHDGAVKVLDFGLAKATEIESSAVDALSNSPTLKTLASTPGMILGTAAYMSPEQAKGRPVDRRTDIFAFGCVLYEMLTGKRAFEGDDVSDILASVLRAEPDWSALPEGTPRVLRIVLERCLVKDRAKRMEDISVAKFLLSESTLSENSTASVSAVPRSVWKTIAWIAAGLVIGISATFALVRGFRPSPMLSSVTRLSIDLPEGQTFSSGRTSNFDISPDGKEIVYSANSQLYRRSLSDFEAKPIPGSENKTFSANPVFSPDGRSIAFYAANDDAIEWVGIEGGTPKLVCRNCGGGSTMFWTAETVLSYSSRGIFRIPLGGGTPELVVKLEDGESAQASQMLPDGEHILFSLAQGESQDRWDKAKIMVQSVKTGERKTLMEGGSNARYVVSGHLLYAVAGTVFAVAFDPRTLKVSGRGLPVLEGVRRGSATGRTSHVAYFKVSDTGTLIYLTGSAIQDQGRTLVLTDRNGAVTPLRVPPAMYSQPRVSPDGKQIAVNIEDGQEAYISIYDVSGAGSLRRLTFDGHSRHPVWSGNSQFVAFQSDREGDLGVFMQRADGSSPAVRLTKPEPGATHVPDSWSSDGRTLLFESKKDATSPWLLWSLSLANKQAMRFGNVQSTPVDPINATFSPDGRWVAYTAYDRPANLPSPNKGTYVQPFPPTGSFYQVPKERNDYHPVWAPTSRELFYIPIASQLSVVSVQTQPNLTFGRPVTLPRPATRDKVSTDFREYDIMPDGKLLSSVAAAEETANAAPQIRVITNWFEELRQRVPIK